MKLSRRELIGTALVVSASAQDTPPDQARLNADALDKVDLPQTAEPAFLFKA